MINHPKPANKQNQTQILDKFVLKHLRPKKSTGSYCQNHSKSALFYENHQSKVMETLKIDDQSS